MILTEFHGVPVHLISLIILLVLDILEYLTELMILFFSLDSFMGLIQKYKISIRPLNDQSCIFVSKGLNSNFVYGKERKRPLR